MRRTLSAIAIATLFLLPTMATGAEELGAAPALEQADLVAPEQAPSLDLEPAGDDLSFLDPLHGTEQKAKYCDPECPEEPSPFSCRDNDSGNRPTVKGTLFFSYYGQVTGVYTDYCTNTTSLVEYWCSSSSNWTTTSYWCGNGCSDGRCL